MPDTHVAAIDAAEADGAATLRDDLTFLVPEFAPLIAGALPVEDDPAIVAWRIYTIMETAVQSSGYYNEKEDQYRYLRDLMSEAEDVFVATAASTLAGLRVQARHLLTFEFSPQSLEGKLIRAIHESIERFAGEYRPRPEDEIEALHARAATVLAKYDTASISARSADARPW